MLLRHIRKHMGGHSLHGSVDWNYIRLVVIVGDKGHSLHGSVDWNMIICIKSAPWFKSLPSRECGLKYRAARGIWQHVPVTPFTGVWIEILRSRLITALNESHSLHGSVDWNTKPTTGYEVSPSHSLHGSVDWNSVDNRILGISDFSHSLHGSVDWNDWRQGNWEIYTVTPFTGVWIEIVAGALVGAIRQVTPFTGVWIEINLTGIITSSAQASLPSRECGLKLYRLSCRWCVTAGHSLHGSVDWNSKPCGFYRFSLVTPFTGVWIEIHNQQH